MKNIVTGLLACWAIVGTSCGVDPEVPCFVDSDCASGQVCSAERKCVASAPDSGIVAKDAAVQSDGGFRADIGASADAAQDDAGAADAVADLDAAAADALAPDAAPDADVVAPDSGSDGGAGSPDARGDAAPDVGFPPDAMPDAGFAPDAVPDAGFAPDAAPDAGFAPMATDDPAIGTVEEESTSGALDVLLNDSPATGVTISAVTNGSLGVVVNNTTNVTYRVNASVCAAGVDSFTYTARNAAGTDVATAGVSIVDTRVPEAITAVTAAYVATANTVQLGFSAPGENGAGSACRVTSYRVVTADNAAMTTNPVTTNVTTPVPLARGQAEARNVTATWGARRYYTIVALDEGGRAAVAPAMGTELDLRQSSTLTANAMGMGNFGSVNLNSFATQTFTVRNTSPLAGVTLSAASVTGGGASHYSISGGALAMPVMLAPNQTHVFTVRYAPTNVGVHPATLTVTHNGQTPAAAHTIALTGTGQVGTQVAPVVSSIQMTPSRVVGAGAMVTLEVTVTDSNSSLPNYDDIASVNIDLTSIGGAASVAMTAGMAGGATSRPYTRTVNTTGLPSGAYSFPVTVTDQGGNRVTDALVIAVYTGTARTVGVGGTYSTIQAAINAASSGDGVVIAPGSYAGPGNVNLTFGANRQIVLAGSGGPAATTIDCNQSGRAFNLLSTGQSVRSAIVGLTVQNCVAGGALRLVDVSPTLGDLVLANNSPGAVQAGSMFLDGTSSVMAHRLRFTNANCANGYAWGASAGSAQIEFRDSAIASAAPCSSYYWYGGGNSQIAIRRSAVNAPAVVGNGTIYAPTVRWFNSSSVGVGSISTSELTIEDSMIDGLRATMIHGNGTSRMARSTIVGVASTVLGEGSDLQDVVFRDSAVTVSPTVIRRVLITGASQLTFDIVSAPPSIQDITINQATAAGPLMYIRQCGGGNAPFVIRNLEISNSVAEPVLMTHSTGCGSPGGSDTTFTNLLVRNNTAVGDVVRFDTATHLENVTIVDNVGSVGVGVRVEASSMIDSIVARNGPSGGSETNIQLSNDTGVGFTVSNSNILNPLVSISDPGALVNNGNGFDCSSGNLLGNRCIDPGFVSRPMGGAYYLPVGSPLINAGGRTSASAGLTTRTTLTTGVLDSGAVDLGWHYLP